MAKTASKSFSLCKSRHFLLFWCIFCTTTPDISISSANINNTARISRLSFRFLWLWLFQWLIFVFSLLLSLFPSLILPLLFVIFLFFFFLFLDILHMNSFNILKISLANVLTFYGPWVVLAQSFVLWRPIKVSLVILDLPALHIFLLSDKPLSTSLLTLYSQCYLHNLKVYTLYLRSVRLEGFEIM